MLDKPHLADEQISACLRATYGLTVTTITFVPLGYDMHAGVYRVRANGQDYFLKVKRDAASELSIRLPRYLVENGLDRVVAPLPTVTGELWGKVDPFTLILYPFIEGESAWVVGLSDEQWVAFGGLLKGLHAMPPPPGVPRETFVPHPGWMAIIRRLHATIQDRVCRDPLEEQLAAYWQAHYAEIGAIIERADQLGRILQERPSPAMLCHADIHTGNLLVDTRGRLFIVDWDQPVLAPVERDLMFVTVGGFVSEQKAEALFLRGYGNVDIDPLVMAYYRYERAMEDLASFGDLIFSTDTGEETRADSLKWFKIQFAPGGLVEAARSLDYVLSD